MSEEFVLFWGGKFSQWYKADMVINGVKYNCCEQYMMAEKARFFEDKETFERIMAEKNPKEQKALGRQVQDFDIKEWNEVARDVVYGGNYAKFNQNKDCFGELMDTGNKTIVEASPYDTIWGIGLSADDPRALDRSQWKGTNWLGKAIMEARKHILLCEQ